MADCERYWELSTTLFPASECYRKRILLWETSIGAPPIDERIVGQNGGDLIYNDVMLLRQTGAEPQLCKSRITAEAVQSDGDWEQVEDLVLKEAAHSERSFLSWMLRQYRILCERGSGSWFRASDERGQAVSTVGIFRSTG